VFLLIFGILSFLIYFNTSSIIEKDLNNANILLLNSIQNDIDKTFEEAQKISVEVFFNPQIQKLLNLKSEISDSEYYQINNTIQSFYLYKSSSKTIDDVYIMLKGINKVVSSWGIKDTYYFYQTSYTNDSEAYKAWMNEYDEKRADKYSLVFTGQNNKEHKILYMRALSQSNNRDLSNSVTISINEDKLVNQLIAVDQINKGTSFILHNDVIVTSSKPIKLPEKFHLPDKERGNTLYTKIEGKKVVVSFITSNASGWKYVTVVPEEVFLAKVNRLKIITYSFIIVCFSLGIGLMYYFLKKNYNPINKLLSILANEPDFMNSDMNTNEYIIIENGLKKAIAEKIEAANRLEDQKQLLKNNFLEKLLKGSAQFEIPITEALHSYEIKFDSNYFYVILFYLDEAFGENEPANISQRDINFIFSNVIGELLSVYHKGLVIEVDNSMACLVNVNVERIKESKNDLQKAIKETQQFLLKYLSLLIQ
jgi:hypothetical protein